MNWDVLAIHIVDGAAPTLAVVVASILTRRKIQEVHILVNSRLTKALERIDALEKQLQDVIGS